MTKHSNVLTNELVSRLYNEIVSGSRISRARFSESELGDLLATVYALNSLPAEARHFNGESINDLSMPTWIDGMLFGTITISGMVEQVPQVLWRNESQYAPMDQAQVNVFNRKFCSTFRSQSEMQNISGKITDPVALMDVVGNLKVNEERVSSAFVNGRYPISSVETVFEDYAEGIKVDTAISLYVEEILKSM